VLTHDTMLHPPHQEPHQDLLRQAYLLTGDYERARQLADRAAGAGELHRHRHGPADAFEYAKAELVRSFVADPGPSQRPGGATAAHPDVATWLAVCRLSPRRRASIVLRYDEGLSEEAAAARLGTSAHTVRADVDAAMLTLRTAVPGVGDPWVRVAEALAAAGRGWSDYTRPAEGRVAELLAAATPPPEPHSRHATATQPGRHSMRPAVVSAIVAAAVLLGAALVVPRLGSDRAPAAPAAAAGVAQQLPIGSGARRAVPTRTVPTGLLNWPPRGALTGNDALVAAAGQAWRAKAPGAEAPSAGLTELWAGTLQGRTVVILQALDRGGHPQLAQVSGPSADSLRLQHAEPLHPGTQLVSVLPAGGPSGPVRVLVSPEAQVADGVLASDGTDRMPLQATPVGADGISPVLPSPPGTPTCSRVVLLGLDPATGTVGRVPRVLFSGIASAEMLGAMPMEVEVGTAALAPSDAQPETAWFADGKKLASKVPGKGTLTVAALGPRLAPQPLSSHDKRTVSSRAYELRRGNASYLGSVIEVGGRTVCASAYPVSAASGPTAWALRCPVPGDMMPGLVHVVGAPGVQSVDVALTPTRSPAGQEAYRGSSTRPEGVPTGEAFAGLQVAEMGFPCGVGTLRVHRDGGTAVLNLPVYRP
jgi:hypothetical protein